MKRADYDAFLNLVDYIFVGVAVAILLLAGISYARAQDVEANWFLQPLAQQCLDNANCRARLHRPRRHRNYAYRLPETYYEAREPRGYRSHNRRDRDNEPTREVASCRPLMEGRGAEANTSEGALRLANRAWQAAVRSEIGERHMDLKNAGDYRWTCFRSSTNESVAGRLLEWSAGAVRMRCKVWARPCLAPIIRGLPEKGSVKQELEEEDALPGANRPPTTQFNR